MCERAEPTGDVFNRERFDTRLIDYEDENFILGGEGVGDRDGEEEEDDGDDDGSSWQIRLLMLIWMVTTTVRMRREKKATIGRNLTRMRVH
jgi:hypothetical protein